jgi:predicted dehydrogenase
VDAVVIATRDHWHAPATILACEAGIHVYVEKPCAHNIRERRLMIEAARRHRRIVQTGTQSRSTAHVIRAMQLLREGAIGEVLVSKAWNSQLRRSIGRAQPSEPPAHLDFDLWVGPAPMVPYQKYFFDDDRQFPDTQYVVFEYGGNGEKKKQLIFEQRIWSPYVQEGYENGNAFYGTEGMLILGKSGGWELFGPRNQSREKMEGRPDGPAHHRNFLECIQSGERPTADVEIGHLSAALCHLGNIATRLGRTLKFDPAAEHFVGDSEASALVGRKYREGHWAIPKGA